MSTSSGSRVDTTFALAFEAHRSRARSRRSPAPIRPRRPRAGARRTRGARPQRGSNSGSLGVEVAAHEVGPGAATAVPEGGDLAHGSGSSSAGSARDSAGACRRSCVVAVGQHDHVTLLGPVPLAVLAGHPARPAGDDVEEDHALRAGVQRVGQRQRGGLERERLGELRTEEERALEPQLLERRGSGVAARTSGVAARSGGSWSWAAPHCPDTLGERHLVHYRRK